MAKDKYGNTVEIGSTVISTTGNYGKVKYLNVDQEGVEWAIIENPLDEDRVFRTSSLYVLKKAPASSVVVTKPYFIEAYGDYYPRGGYEDMYSGFDDINAAKLFAYEQGYTQRDHCSIITITENGEFKLVSGYTIGEGWKDVTP